MVHLMQPNDQRPKRFLEAVLGTVDNCTPDPAKGQPWGIKTISVVGSLLDWVGRLVQSARVMAGQRRGKQLIPLAALKARFSFVPSVPSFSIS